MIFEMDSKVLLIGILSIHMVIIYANQLNQVNVLEIGWERAGCHKIGKLNY